MRRIVAGAGLFNLKPTGAAPVDRRATRLVAGRCQANHRFVSRSLKCLPGAEHANGSFAIQTVQKLTAMGGEIALEPPQPPPGQTGRTRKRLL
jgi:hypothetical protein